MNVLARVPVKTGVGASGNLAAALFTTMPAAAAVVCGVVALFTHHAIIGVASVLIGALVVLITWVFVSDCIADQAVDVTLRDDGVLLEGPSATVSVVSWDDLRVDAMEVSDKGGLMRMDISIPCKKGPPLCITGTMDETEALRNFVNMLRLRAGFTPIDTEALWHWNDRDSSTPPPAVARSSPAKRERPKRERANRSEIALCTSCGAPLAPVEERETKCDRCGAKNEMPAEVSARLAAARKHHRTLESRTRKLAGLQRQPTARTVRFLSRALALVMVAAWGFAVWTGVRLYLLGRLDLVLGLVLFGFALGVGFGAWTAQRAYIASRATTMLTLLELSASAPSEERREPSCRCCGAPLAVLGDDTVVASCGYCGTQNLLAFLVPREQVLDETNDVRALEEALESRSAERGLFIAMTAVIGAPVAIGGVVGLLYALSQLR